MSYNAVLKESGEGDTGNMARKTKQEAEKTRELILESALEVFYEKGFSRTTLNDIAQNAGMTRGAIYWHFTDKVELYTQLAQSIEEQTDFDPNLFSKRANSLGEIEMVIHAYLALFKNKKYLMFYEISNYKTEWMEELSEVLEAGKKEVKYIVDSLQKDFAHLQKKGMVKKGLSPNTCAITLCGLVEGLIQLWFFAPDLFDLQTKAKEIMADFFNGLKP